MISGFGLRISRVVERVVPDPFVIAIFLTLVTAIAALLWGDFGDQSSFIGVLDSWRDSSNGMWKLLSFSMQMCLILVTGYALATTSLVRSMIHRLADIPTSTAAAAAIVGLVACICGLVNWGLGLIVVGFSMQRRNKPCHYPLIAAAGYVGLLVWHGGLSGSAPLSMTTKLGAEKVVPTQFLDQLESISLSSSIGSPMNLLISGGLVLLIPTVLASLAPKNANDIRPIDTFGVDSGGRQEPIQQHEHLPDKLNHSPYIAWLLAVPLLIALCRYMYVSGIDRVGLNEITMFMLGAGLLLHGSPVGYMQAVARGAKGCAGIIIQFPLYAGIMAIMVASGLMGSLTELMVGMGSKDTLPLLTMLSAGIVNLFVPSGGGQWAIQAPIALESGLQSGVSPGTMVMAVAYGDQLTNMLQPFWALPLLAITGVRARDIVGYTVIVMVAATVWIAFGLLIAG